ncbi:MAG: flavin reductase family protein [Desulfurococcaceae archaeon]
MPKYVEIDPNDYGVLHPRPAYLIATRSPEGRLNVMAASWVQPVHDEPLTIGLAIDSEALTHENLLRTGELTINVVGREMLDQVYTAGRYSGREVDKWALAKFRPVPSKHVGVPGIEGAYAIIECAVVNKIPVHSTTLFLCESRAIRVAEGFFKEGGWDYGRARIALHDRGRSFVFPGEVVRARPLRP